MTSAGELPRLHIVTDDAILIRPDVLDVARDVFERAGPRLAFHLRGHATAAGRLYALGSALARVATSTGSWLFVNDRIDVALAADAAGVQLGRRSIPMPRVRALIGARRIGYSAHSADEASTAERDGTDFVVLGTIYPTASHPSAEPAGPGLVREATSRVGVPVIAIGGVTPDRAAELVAAGAHGVAAITGVWNAGDIGGRIDEYLAALVSTQDKEMMNAE